MAKKKGKRGTPTKAPRRPRQQRLEGVAEGRDAILDRQTRVLADVRERKSEDNAREATAIAVSIERMKHLGWDAYTQNGIELLRSSTEKLRVRTVDDSNASTSEE